MPSFLSRVFGRKKDDKEKDKDTSPTQLSPGELLGGRFEAISPNTSPNATKYLDLDPGSRVSPIDAVRFNEKEKEFGFAFFRSKSRPSSPEGKPKRLLDTLPALSLDFDEPNSKSTTNGHIFDQFSAEVQLSDAAISQRRLKPQEALVLVQACSQAIVSRGLETLGIMTPHWYSASPNSQRALISKFLKSLDAQNPAVNSPLSPPAPTFEDEVNFTLSIHDVAAVLRWGLRHLQIEGDSFGRDGGWYNAFVDAEAADDYPPRAFSEKLAPLLPASHFDLLVATLEIFSSLAGFSESNSTSGSKLSKIFGLWLLDARRVEDKDDWRTFYVRWERTGRMLEHLFLARIRDQSADGRIPVRLLELVRKYPYTHDLSSPSVDLRLLPRPPSTTVLIDALYVRVEYELVSEVGVSKSKTDPSVFLADALSTKVLEGECVGLWNKITRAASKTGTEAPLSSIFANETIQLLSLVADKCKDDVKSPTFSLVSLPDYRRSLENPAPPSRSVGEPATAASPLSPINIGSDWEQFSTSGFLNDNTTILPLASTLLDTDIEKTVPPDQPTSISRKSSKLIRRKSYETRRSVAIAGSYGESSPEPIEKLPSSEPQKIVKISNPEITQLDESFFDFWSDALLDPISSDWPAFVVCKFKSTLVPELTFGSESERTLKWLVLEVCVKPLPPTPFPQAEAAPRTSSSSVPPTPSGKRRFNFWSLSRTPSSSSTGSHKAKKAPKTPKVGEMGELVEEGESRKDIKKVKDSKKRRSLDLSGRKKAADPVPDTEDDKAKFAPAGVAATGAIIAGAVSATADVPDTDGEQLVGGERRLVAASQEGPTLQDDTFAVEQPAIVEQTAQDEVFVSHFGVALPPVAEESVDEGQGIEEVVEPGPEAIDDELQPTLVLSGDTSTSTEQSIPSAIVDISEVAAEVQLDETPVALDEVADNNADIPQQEDFVQCSEQEEMAVQREGESSGAVPQAESSGEVAVAVPADIEPFEDQSGLSIAEVVEGHVIEQLLEPVDADVPAEVATVEEKPSGSKVAVGVAEGTMTPVEDATEEGLVAIEETSTTPEATTLTPVQVIAKETPTIPEATQACVVEVSPVVVEEVPAFQAESYAPGSAAEFEKAPEVAREVFTATEVIPAPMTDSESLVAEVVSTPSEISIANDGPEGIVEDAPRKDAPSSVGTEHEEMTVLSEGDSPATIEQGVLEEPEVAFRQLTPTVEAELTDVAAPSAPAVEVPVTDEAPALVEEVAQMVEEIPADIASSEIPTTIETPSPSVDEVETVDGSLSAEQPCVPIDEPLAALDEAPEVVEEVLPIGGEFSPPVEQATVPPGSPSRSEESPLVDGEEPGVIEQESTIDEIVEDQTAVVEQASTLAGEAPVVIEVESRIVEGESPASETDTPVVGEPSVVFEEKPEVIQTIGENAPAPEEAPVVEESPAILEEMATPIQEASTSAEQAVETDAGLFIDEKATEVVEGATDIHQEVPTMLDIAEQSALDVGNPPAPTEDPAAGLEGISFSVEEPTVVDDPPVIEDVPSALANELPIVEAVLVEEVDAPGLEGVHGEEPDFVTGDVAADITEEPIEVPAAGETAGDGSSHDATVQLSSEVETPTVEVNNTMDDPQTNNKDHIVHESLPPIVSFSSPEICVASSTDEPPSANEPPPKTNEPVVTVLNGDNDNVKLETDETIETIIVEPVLASETVHADVEMNEPVPNRSHEDLSVDVGGEETKEVEMTIVPKVHAPEESALISEAP